LVKHARTNWEAASGFGPLEQCVDSRRGGRLAASLAILVQSLQRSSDFDIIDVIAMI
jgi:hypothetical protein